MKRIITLYSAIILASGIFAQSPDKMSYQAVIRNSTNQLVSNQTVGMRISILQGSSSGSSIYTETHTTTTNANGLASIEIGNGTVINGVFGNIDWSNGPYFIKTETDPSGGVNYSISGTSQLLSVPYALHAKTAENITGSISETDPIFNTSVAAGITAIDTANWNNHFSGDYNDLTNQPVIPTVPTNVSAFTNDAGYLTSETDPVFNASIAAGITAVDTANWNNHFSGDYNDLSNAPVIPTVPTNVSAFTNDAGYLTGYTETDPLYSSSPSAGITSTDITNWNNQMSQAWNINGNNGIDPSTNFIGTTDAEDVVIKTNNTEQVRITSSGNVGIGTNNPTFKLEVIADATFNGVRVGRGNGNVVTNTAIGADALNNNTSSDRNTAVGYLSLSSNSSGSRNTAIGAESMKNNTTGNWNTSIGDNALVLNTIGTHNSAFGALALNANISGGGNTAAGYGSLMTLTGGIQNSGFGMYSNKSLTTGNNNAALGYEAGYLNSTGSGNVFLGYQAGYNETGSNKLYIANSSTSTPLIYGDFSSSRIGLGTNNPQYNLDVTGDINFTGEIRKNGSPIVMDGSETKVNAGNNITVTGNGTTATPYTISAGKPKFYLGQDTLGGYVYYIYLDANGEQHGLIVSKTETTANWSSSSGLVGADRTYDGSYNMVLMFNSTARDWVSTNFTSEWFLPSIDQLILLFNARMHVNKALHWGGFTQLSFNNSYWSSFEYDSSAGMYLHFSNSETGAATKSTNMLVRAVRTF